MGAGGSDGARGSAVERNLDAGPAGSGRAVARATSRGVGEAVIVEGISPGRAAAETSPDRTHRRKCFYQREALTPKKISYRTWPTRIFFQT